MSTPWRRTLGADLYLWLFFSTVLGEWSSHPGGIAPNTETRCQFSRLGGTQSRSGLSGEAKNSLPLLELQRRIVQPVA
jgi:hypothetical protein